jgi:hypothetical protein
MLGSCCSDPDWKLLEAQGDEIIRLIEGYRATHGDYPSSLEAVGAHPSKTKYGQWQYMLNLTEGFFLSVGDYGRDCFELYYSPKIGWTRSS